MYCLIYVLSHLYIASKLQFLHQIINEKLHSGMYPRIRILIASASNDGPMKCWLFLKLRFMFFQLHRLRQPQWWYFWNFRSFGIRLDWNNNDWVEFTSLFLSSTLGGSIHLREIDWLQVDGIISISFQLIFFKYSLQYEYSILKINESTHFWVILFCIPTHTPQQFIQPSSPGQGFSWRNNDWRTEETNRWSWL